MTWEKKIDELPDGQIQVLLKGMYTRAAGSLEAMEAGVARWFDEGMDRVSGGYKRQAQLISFVIALALVGLFNLDSIDLFRALWVHPALAIEISARPASATDALAKLQALPIGWTAEGQFRALSIVGWLLTASAALFGAPFWFDLLQRLANVRGAGNKPT